MIDSILFSDFYKTVKEHETWGDSNKINNAQAQMSKKLPIKEFVNQEKTFSGLQSEKENPPNTLIEV